MDLDAKPNQLRSISQILFSAAVEINEIYASIQLKKHALAETWHDQRSQAFLARLDELLPAILQSFLYLQQFSEYLDQRASTVDEYLNPT